MGWGVSSGTVTLTTGALHLLCKMPLNDDGKSQSSILGTATLQRARKVELYQFVATAHEVMLPKTPPHQEGACVQGTHSMHSAHMTVRT